MATEITRSPDVAADQTEMPFITGEELSIAVDNGSFDTDHDFAIRAKNFKSFVIQLINTGGLNALDFEIYGTLINTDAIPAFGNNWTLLENAVGTIAASANDSFFSNQSWAWIIIRLKEDIATSNTTADIRIGATY